MKELTECIEKYEEGVEKTEIANYVNNVNILMSSIGEAVGFFFGCWIGIGTSYVSAFNLAAYSTMIIVVI